MIELGGNITLVGFKDIGFSEMVVIKKIIGNYARKITDKAGSMDNLTATVKPIHKNQEDDGCKYELHIKVIQKGKVFTTEVVDFNIFVAIDTAMKKIFSEMKIND